jgi:hypothetical protein
MIFSSYSQNSFTPSSFNDLSQSFQEYWAYLQKKGWFFSCSHLSDARCLSERTTAFFPDPWAWLSQLMQNCHNEISQNIEIDSENFQDQVMEFCLKKLEYLMPYRFLLQEIFIAPDLKGIQIFYSKNSEFNLSYHQHPSQNLFKYFQIHNAFLFFILVKGIFLEEKDLVPDIQNQVDFWFKTFYSAHAL